MELVAILSRHCLWFPTPLKPTPVQAACMLSPHQQPGSLVLLCRVLLTLLCAEHSLASSLASAVVLKCLF